jgi:hypothetical protein
MVGITRLASTDQAGLLGNKSDMIAIANPPWFGIPQHGLVSVTTIRRAELMPSATALTRANDQAIRRALENAGVEFIDAEAAADRPRLAACHSR